MLVYSPRVGAPAYLAGLPIGLSTSEAIDSDPFARAAAVRAWRRAPDFVSVNPSNVSAMSLSVRWRNRRTGLQKAQWASLEGQGWTLAIIGRDGGDILVSALREGERASLRLKKEGTVYGLSAEEPIVKVRSPSVQFLSESDAKARELGY